MRIGFADLLQKEKEEQGRQGEAHEQGAWVPLDALGLGEPAEGFVDGHVADQRDAENRAEGSAGLLGEAIADVTQNHGETGSQTGSDQHRAGQCREVAVGEHQPGSAQKRKADTGEKDVLRFDAV